MAIIELLINQLIVAYLKGVSIEYFRNFITKIFGEEIYNVGLKFFYIQCLLTMIIVLIILIIFKRHILLIN